ncbi:hypothetical protein DYB32_002891 [Aphanomyces invadans]|uniref:DNA-directed RNA polymerase III subunit RPC3 n=1 Tax=Aphanomyces invadans TaxID=157072 RepID=A0A3R6W0E4_9STRA|nr:hypothetical protein DYB32_002891 [Aphanomyces invadans]
MVKRSADEILSSIRKRILTDYSEERLETLGLCRPGQLDAVLNRYLVARNHDEEAALTMLRNSIVWRIEVDMPKLMSGLALPADKLEIIRRYNDLPKLVIIYDLSGIGMHTFRSEVFAVVKTITSLNQDHYPETLFKVLIVHAPFFFNAIYRIIQAFLPAAVRDKVEFCDRGHLLDIVDAAHLPAFLGGTCTCEPLGPSCDDTIACMSEDPSPTLADVSILPDETLAVMLVADDGGYTLRELVQHSLSSPPAHLQPRPKAQHIKTALLKLLQHNLLEIKATWLPADSAKKLPYIIRYELNHEEALLRLRFTRYIELAREVFGEEVLQLVLVLGISHRFNATADEDELEDIKESLKNTFLNMAKNRYILRVHPLDFNKKKAHDFDSGEAEFETTVTTTASSSSNSTDTTTTIKHKKRKGLSTTAADPAVPIEVQLMMQAESNSLASLADGDDTPVEPVTSESGTKRRRLKRAKLPTVGAASSAEPSAGLVFTPQALVEDVSLKEENTIWRYGGVQLTRELRHRTCIQFAHESINVVAQAIVKAMLAHSSPHERDANEATSFPMTARDLFAIPEVHDAVPSKHDRWKMLLNFLTAMCQHPSGMLTKTAPEVFDPTHAVRAGDGGTYSVHMQNIVRTLQRKSIQAFVHEKYGAASARLVRVITEQRQLEQKTLGEMALLPAAETRSRLFEMYRDKLLNLQEIPKRTDYNPQFTLYCWSIDDARLTRRLLERAQSTIVKLRARRKGEAESHKDLIARSDQLVEQNDLDKFDRVSRSLDRLDRATLHLDHMLMLFDQF